MITEQEALEGFSRGIVCAQATFGEFAEELGLDRETALKIAAAFGGGMWHGETCGCVTASIMALGLKYAQKTTAEMPDQVKLLEAKEKFEKKFAEKYGSCLCRNILGYNIDKPDEAEKIMEEKLFEKICCKAVVSACEILRDIFNETDNQ